MRGVGRPGYGAIPSKSIWLRSTTRSRAKESALGRRDDTEVEHHPALHVFRDMTVGHPQPRVGCVHEDVDGLAGAYQDGVFPHEVRLDYTIARQHQEALAVDMERMMHRVIRFHLVDQSDLDLITFVEAPVDVRVRLAGVAIDELPPHVLGRGRAVEL